MKIYTRRGDTGETDLFGGGRAPKDAVRVEAYGTIDELNATMGWVISAIASQSDLVALMQSVQSDLFGIGAELAAAPEADPEKLRQRMAPISPARIAEMEEAIDRYEEGLEPLRNFILPGGSEPGARLHIARAVCRRAERRVVTLAREESIAPEIVQYINRLSDLLFVLARAANKRAGVPETVWIAGG